MTELYRANRKASDEDIIRLNSLGFPLSRIGEELGCHPTTVTQRLESLGVKPADTRRAFMADIYESFPEAQMEWLEQQLGPHTPIKEYIKNLLTKEFMKAKGTPNHAH